MTLLREQASTIFAAKGEMAALMRACNWAATPLGAAETWPQSLRSAVGICLNTRYPMCIYWGPEYIMLYNDAFKEMMGDKHPWGLGRPVREVGPENFGSVEARFAKVFQEGEAIWSEDELFPYREAGRLKERYFNYTLSPIPGEGGAIAGVLNTVIETSYRVISERRSRLLRDLVEGTAGAISASSVCSRTVELLASGAADVPFSLIYKPNWEKGGREARFFAAGGIEAGGPASPSVIPLDAESASWPLHRVCQTGQIEIVEDLTGRFGVAFPGGAWPENAHSAAVVPIWLATDKHIPDAFLVLGLNPRQDFDDAYRSFAERVAGILKDAFVRGKAYDAEKKSAEEHRATVDFAMNLVHEAVYLADEDARILYVNDEAARALGYSREELFRMRVSGIDPDYPPERWSQHFRDMAVARSGTFETRHKTKDGRIFPVEMSTNYFEYEGKAYIMGLARDISERRRAEEERRRAEEQRVMLECAMDRIHEAAYLIGTEGGFLYVNGEACRALGYSREELLGMSVRDIDPDFPALPWQRYLSEYSIEPSRTFETRHKTKDGRIFPVEITSSTFVHGGVEHRMSLARDISERKQAEEERRRAEEERVVLEFGMDSVHEGAFLIGDDGRFLYVNGEASRSLGYSREELLRMSVRDIDPDVTQERWDREFRGLAHSTTFETRHKSKDGRVFPVEISANFFEYGGTRYIMSLVRDISGRKRAEEERRRVAEQRDVLEFAMERVHEGAFLIRNDGHFLYVNAEAARSLDYSREELLGLGVPDIDPDFPPERFAEHMREVAATGSVAIETRHMTKNGRIFPVEIHANFFEYEGNAYLMALSRDISERKRAEEELRRKTEELDSYFTIAQDLFCIASLDGYFLRLNPAWEHTLGYTAEELQARPFVDFVHPEDLAATREAVGQLARHKELVNFPNRYRCKDGSYRWIEWRSVNVGGRIYAAARDITWRKRQEAERLSHLRFFECMDRVNRAIQGASDLEQMMQSVLDVTLAAFDCDRAWLLFPADPGAPSWRVPMERSRPEYAGSPPTQGDIVMDPQTAAKFRQATAATGPLKYGGAYEDKLPEVAGQFQIRSQICMAIYPKLGKPWLFGLHQCSYDRVWTPEEEQLFQEIGRRISDSLSSLLSDRDLRQKEQKYREIFDNVSDSLTLYDIAGDGRFVLADMNPCAEHLMGMAKAKAVGRYLEDAVSKPIAAHSLPLFRQCVETGKPLTYDEDLDLPGGTYSLHTTLLPVRNEAGSIYRLIAFNHDITERKAYEKHLHLLMREVNHRAKNLLAVVQAVVRQTAGEVDPKLFEARLNERIAALAASHDLLVKNEWRGVDTGTLVETQLAHFKDLIGTRVILRGPPALLRPEAAQALGMALHELATNAGKYGALSCRGGSVHVEWEIAANGRGPYFKIRWIERGGPPPKQPERQGFGQKVMVQMAEYALEGKVSLTYPASGLVWELAAPVERAIENEGLPAPALTFADTRPEAAGG
jgi:PAS domain S-box-containing protein